ncbi:MAG: hypothetical protein ACM3QU_06015 [Verrucomicrobiota bacterium]
MADRFVDEVVAVYRSRELAECALGKMLRDEPEWEGMIEVVPVQDAVSHWRPRGRRVRAPRCRR